MFGLNDMLEQPWALEPSRLSRIAAQLARPEAERAAGFMTESGPVAPTRIGPVSVIPVLGVLTHRPGLESLFGMGTSVEEIRAHLRSELNDPSVRAVVLDIDSPGGTVAGIPELATEIRALRERQPKPIVAVANTVAASAAYWLGAQASEFFVTPSGSVGSVGIYAVHQEGSKHFEAEGITTTVVGIPDAKIDANEWTPLSEEARAHIESRAREFYGQFVGDVAAGRRVSAEHAEAHFGGGRMLLAKNAKSAGMVDGVATLDATVSRLFKALGGGQAPKRSALRALEHQLVGEMGAAEVHAYDSAVVSGTWVGDQGSETITIPAGTGIVGPITVVGDAQAKAIGSHDTPTTPGEWDAAAHEARLPSGDGAAATLRRAYAWQDPDGDPDAKASYRFIHHEVSADGTVGAANLTACSAGIAVLNGGRGGTTIPDADVAGVYAHLAAHIRDADREPPALRSEAPDDDWQARWDALPFSVRLEAVAEEALELVGHAQERARLRAKESRPLISLTTEKALRSIHDAIETLLTPADPVPEVAAIAPVAPVVQAPIEVPPVSTPKRFANDAAWLAHLRREYETDVRN